jgi:apolipoprotein N-acyltransferase
MDVAMFRSGWRKYGLLFLAGFGLALGLPPVSQVWLAFLSFAVALCCLGPRPLFREGVALGFGYFCFAFHWIGYAFFVDAEAYLWMMPFAVGGLSLFMALYWGVAFKVSGYLKMPVWLAVPATISVVEWLRGYLFTGFPWAVPGLMADGLGGVFQLASVVGMPGLTFLILLWGGALAAVWQVRRQRGLLALPVVCLALLPAAWVWGEWRLTAAVEDTGKGPLVRLVQPNISQSDKWRSDNAVDIFETLLRLSADGEKPDVVIWPESAVPFLLDESAAALSQIAEVLEPNQVLLTGSIRRTGLGTKDEKYFTSILLIDSEGAVLNSYDKWRLVPGGEYLPLAWALEPLGFRKVVSLPESFSAGPGPQNLSIPGFGKVAMLICYEVIFPHQLVPAAQRPSWIVNVTNDGWFGLSVGPYQHFAQVRMRAVEQGLPVARAANTGISAVVDGYGRVVKHLPLGHQGNVDAKLPPALAPPFFAVFGLLPVALVFALGLLSFGLLWHRFTDKH